MLKNNLDNTERKDRLLKGLFLLLFIGILYIVYIFQIKPVISTNLPEHNPRELDKPPLELTSFQIRESGELLTPQAIAIHNDTIFVSCVGLSWLKLYSPDLNDLNKITLKAPEAVYPISVAIQDSLIIVADSLQGMLLIFDLSGHYQTSVSWYPFRENKLKPVHVSSNDKLIAVTDITQRKIGLISLIDNKPFVEFMELLIEIPKLDRFEQAYCALIAPDGNIWIGDKNKAYIFTEKSQLIKELPEGNFNRITQPVDFAIQNSKSNSASKIRIHMLDKKSGKVFVYDLNGELTLIYPQDRILDEPSSIAINDNSCHIYISEQGTEEITVFGF